MAEKEYIERGALLKRFAELHDGGNWLVNDYNADWIHSFIETATAADVVPRDVLKQVKWERDVAIKQLEEHGIPFGGKADVVEVVRCKDCVKRNTSKCAMWFDCEKCGGQWSWESNNGFCNFGERKEQT